MTKAIDHGSFDKALDDIANNANVLHLCSSAPANYAGIAAVSLGHVTLVTGDGNGTYTKQNGAVSGRRLTMAQQTVLGTGVGVATHAVIADIPNTIIKQITTAPNYNMTNGGNQTVPSFDILEIEDPT